MPTHLLPKFACFKLISQARTSMSLAEARLKRAPRGLEGATPQHPYVNPPHTQTTPSPSLSIQRITDVQHLVIRKALALRCNSYTSGGERPPNFMAWKRRYVSSHVQAAAHVSSGTFHSTPPPIPTWRIRILAQTLWTNIYFFWCGGVRPPPVPMLHIFLPCLHFFGV